MPGLSGADVATPLLFRIFSTIDYDSDEEWFAMPPNLDIRQVCSETGMVPSEHCESRILDHFIPLVSSTRHCDNRQEILISSDEKMCFCKTCAPSSGYKKKWYTLIDQGM